MANPGAVELVERSLRMVERISGLREGRRTWLALELQSDLMEADRVLSRRLRRIRGVFGGGSVRFTEAAAMAYQRQIHLAIQGVENNLRGRVFAQSAVASERSVRELVRLFGGLERRFTGIVRPLRLEQAAELSRVLKGAEASLMARHATSVDRYGQAMVREFEKRIRVGLLSGSSMDDMTAVLTGHGGPRGDVSMSATVTRQGVIRLREEAIPEGLFRRYRYWAERLIRTETMAAYNGARLEGLRAMRQDFGDLKKKIVAVLDDRTAEDSLLVNGQIRDVEDYFVDGAGRHYLYPPARPNDRETVIPWRTAWDEAPRSRRLTQKEIEVLDTSRLPPERRRVLLARLAARARRTPSVDAPGPPR